VRLNKAETKVIWRLKGWIWSDYKI